MALRVLTLTSYLAWVGCAGAETSPNVLLVTLDTTRADRLGCYGYDAAGTSTLDGLADEGVRFARAYAHTPLTLASHATLLTGLYPREHGLHVNGGGQLAEGIPTLAERLRDHGYRTGAFVSSFVLDEVFGLGRGFDLYDDTMGTSAESRRFESERPADRVTDAALAWLAQADERPFFAWVHYYDPHSGYDPPAAYKQRFDDPYDGEIAFVDDQLGRIVEYLDANGLRGRTLIVVAGDHGEAFGEHGETDHGLFVYDTTIRVPLIIAWPGNVGAGLVPDVPAGLVDIYPTALELGGLAGTAQTSGRSLAPALRGEAEPFSRTVYAESRLGQIGYGWAPLRAIVDGKFKYVEAPRPELYDLTDDPGETVNRAGDLSDRAADLRRALRVFERAHDPREVEDVDLDSDAMARLRSLGYVGGTDATSVDLDADIASLRDPKDMLEVYRGHLRAVQLIARRKYTEAAALLEQLLARSPESLDLYENLGFAYLALGRAEAAEAAYRKSLTRMPEHAERLWGLGEALRRQNRTDEAIPAYEAALEHRPALGEAHMALAQIYAVRGERKKALHHARRHAELNPGSTTALQNLADTAFSAGELDLALATAESWVAVAPSSREAHNARWQLLHEANRRQESIDALRSSVAAFPDDWNMISTLAWFLAVTPDRPASDVRDAVRLAEAAVALNPTNPRSYDVLAAAQAAAGNFEAAVAAAEAGIQRADATGAPRARDAIASRLGLYRAGQPYRK